jgi:hypothetical protein
LIAVVVGELSEWKAFFPFHAEGDYTGTEHVFKDLIDSFNLTTHLRMISCAKKQIGSHSLLKACPKSGSEAASAI